MSLSPESLSALARGSRRTAAISLASGLLVVGALGASAWAIWSLQERRETLAAEVAGLEASRARLKGELLGLQDTLNGASLKLAQGEVKAAETLLEKAPKPAAAPTVSGAPVQQGPPPQSPPVIKRAYFHMAADAQRPVFETCAKTLVGLGYRVPQVEMVDVPPAANQVRYFRSGDEPGARRLAGDLAGCLGASPRVILVRGYENSRLVRPSQYEVWLSPPPASAG